MNNDFDLDDPPGDGRLSQLSPGQHPIKVNRGYSAFVRKLRFILPLIALGMTVIILTWDEAGRRIAPLKKEEVMPQSQNIQNELLKPVFNSIDEKQQPYTVTADRATQGRENPDIVELARPIATLKQNDGTTLDADAASGLYEQKSQKLNLEGDVHLRHSDGTLLKTEELRVDLATQKAYSGRDVRVENKSGTIDATGLEGDAEGGTLIFTGPAKVTLYSNGDLLTPKENTP